jgi:hypothetical protein
MDSFVRKVAGFFVVAGLIGIAACSGSLGTGTGLPAPPGPAVSAAGQNAGQSRQRTAAGAVYLASDMHELPMPPLAGFGMTVELATPTPKASGAATSVKGKANAAPTAAPPTASPAASASPAAKKKATPSPSGTPNGPKIDTKITIFPEDAPAAPTPAATGNVQSYAERPAIIRGYIMSPVDIKLYSLAAIVFKLPADQRPEDRGFSIALFESHKHRKWKVLGWTPDATLDDETVSAADATDPIVLHKKTGYAFVLYGDDLEPTAAPRGTYPPAGSNPFSTPGVATPRPFGMPPTPFSPYGQPQPSPSGYYPPH